MGEAKRRAAHIAKLKAERDGWLSGLTAAEKEIYTLADRLEERLVRGKSFTEGCYHLSFFMTRYLAEKGIEVEPVVGWVNDGTWDGVASHAWIEFEGKKTDVSMTRTSFPDEQPPGALIILDQVIKPGLAEYSYFKNDHPYARKQLEVQREHPELALLQRHKDAQHDEMVKIAEGGRVECIDAYLAGAPQGLKYSDLKRLVE